MYGRAAVWRMSARITPGYLQRWWQPGHCPRAIASDLRTGPVNAARLTVNAAGLEKRIDIRQGDGLAPLSAEEADDIVIAGMGGETIAGILDAASWTRNSHFRFILQPMTRVGYLHRYLLQHGFSILREEAAEEAGRLYVVLLAQFTASPPAAEDDPKIWIGALSPYGLDKLYLQKPAAVHAEKSRRAAEPPLSFSRG